MTSIVAAASERRSPGDTPVSNGVFDGGTEPLAQPPRAFTSGDAPGPEAGKVEGDLLRPFESFWGVWKNSRYATWATPPFDRFAFVPMLDCASLVFGVSR
ncbi:hypothetical protein ZHAS_00019099 [Anopheles sinensis]|uniref:Uncharacterized protein n=1 Tax=Anopheles sinensis TaxID=74873 RepID=A0A084WLF3_ANOSI|nr:hypothetical protein ZHAS_00019099 [Anopheles sinensis]